MEEILDLAIIGSGPGGIASAVEARIRGVKRIVVFEKGQGHSMTLRKFYKDGKRVDKDYKGKIIELDGNIHFLDGTKESTLDLFDKMIEKHSIDVRFGVEIDRVEKVGDIFEVLTTGGEKFKARFVILSIGKMGKPNKPSYPIPLGINSKVNFDANSVKDGEKLLVVGGGNSAVEYACVLCQTNEVTHNHRGSTFSKLNDTNLELLHQCANEGKLKTRWGVEIIGLEDDGNGNPKVNFADETSEVFDRVVFAIGGSSPVNFLKRCGVELDEQNVPVVNDCHRCNIPGMYIAGDILYRTGGSIGEALNHGFHIADCIAFKVVGGEKLCPGGCKACKFCDH